MTLNKSLHLFCLVITIACYIGILNAQENSAKTLWLGATIQYKIDKKFSVKNTILHRFRTNVGYLNSFHQPFVNYKINKDHAVGIGYRGTWIDAQDEHWILLEYKFNKKLGENFKLANRFWFQYIIDYNDVEFRDHFRNHLALHFTKFKKIQPYVGFEPWFQINGVNEINRIRSLAGINWKIHKQLNFKTEYFRQETFWTDPNFVQNVLLMTLTATISSKKLIE